MGAYPPPSPPVVGGVPAHESGTNNLTPINRVVIHSAVATCEVGMARKLATWNRTGQTGGSWHYAVDPAETIQCSWDRFVCWHAPPNRGSIGVEMADMPARVPTVTGTARHLARASWRWADLPHRKMLARTARLTAELCLAYDLPVVFLSPADLKAGHRGITTHANVTAAFGQSTHWDPGFWPRRRFMRLVREACNDLTLSEPAP